MNCEHGVAADDGRYDGVWAAPFSRCTCCGILFPYIDMASWQSGIEETETGDPDDSQDAWVDAPTTWAQMWTKDRCEACGGQRTTS
jgi:hypothetical protein